MRSSNALDDEDAMAKRVCDEIASNLLNQEMIFRGTDTVAQDEIEEHICKSDEHTTKHTAGEHVVDSLSSLPRDVLSDILSVQFRRLDM
nr:hypothetical protein [Tanacetum cinerariifolium]